MSLHNSSKHEVRHRAWISISCFNLTSVTGCTTHAHSSAISFHQQLSYRLPEVTCPDTWCWIHVIVWRRSIISQLIDVAGLRQETTSHQQTPPTAGDVDAGISSNYRKLEASVVLLSLRRLLWRHNAWWRHDTHHLAACDTATSDIQPPSM